MLEAALAAPFDSALASSLLAPLQLRETFVYSAATRSRPRAAGHQSFFGLNVARREPLPPPALAPAGFVAASAHDLARFGGALANRGALAGESLLEPAFVAALLAPMDSTGPAMAWGYGRRDGVRYFEHAGNARTSSARVRVVPAHGYSIAVLANTNSGPFLSATEDIMSGVHAILEGERAPNPWPRERLLKGAILIGTAWSLVSLAQRARAWDDAGRPTRIDGKFATTGPLVFDVGGAVFLLTGLPRMIGVPVHTLGEYFPDLAIGLTVSAVAGATGGVLRAWTRSAP
jgi:CubicO group peptidase (beta-lactamase class C family)